MQYTKEEIRDLPNPYQDLGNADALLQHLEEINQLSKEEKIDLATRMVLECPQDELRSFGRVIEAARNPQTESAFHSILSEAHGIKSRVFALLDPKNKNPHQMILGDEFSTEFFSHNSHLTLTVLNNNEAAIAERLAITTPQDQLSDVLKKIQQLTFKELAAKVNAAFTLRSNIDQLLLSDNPERFFTSRDFNVEQCHEYASLLTTLLNGHEQSIGKKLSQLDDNTLSNVSMKLEQLNNKAHDAASPFRLIATEIKKEHEPKLSRTKTFYPEEKPSHAANPYSQFNTHQRHKKSRAVEHVDHDEEKDNAHDKRCIHSCNLL